jgi:hypothetical protein
VLVASVRDSRPSEPVTDPFGEKRSRALRLQAQILGGRFRFECEDSVLVRIAQAAYANLPAHRLATPAPHFVVRLMLTQPSIAVTARDEPPPVSRHAGGAVLCGAMGAGSFMAIEPEQRAALLVVGRDSLRFPYHVRYELLESAVYMLASRVQRLVPLHAACVGLRGAGVLLVGRSGSGKSTVTLHSVLAGLDFLAEDSVMVRPEGMLATGIASFLHIRRDSLRFLGRTASAARIRESRLIRRRSGVVKLEVDARRCGWRLAKKPLKISAVVFVTRRAAGKRQLLAALRPSEVAARLSTSQRYAAGQPGWTTFMEQVRRIPAYELRRGHHPREAAEALRGLLAERHRTMAR